MKFNEHITWLRNILFRFIIQVFFLLKKVLFFVKGQKVDEGSEEKR